MEKQKYIVVNALIYEVILFLQEFSAFFKTNPWIKQILKNCFEDWCAYRAEREMIEVDKQVQELHKLWDEEEKDYIRVFKSGMDATAVRVVDLTFELPGADDSKESRRPKLVNIDAELIDMKEYDPSPIAQQVVDKHMSVIQALENEVVVDAHFRIRPIGDAYYENRQRVLFAIHRAVAMNEVKYA